MQPEILKLACYIDTRTAQTRSLSASVDPLNADPHNMPAHLKLTPFLLLSSISIAVALKYYNLLPVS